MRMRLSGEDGGGYMHKQVKVMVLILLGGLLDGSSGLGVAAFGRSSFGRLGLSCPIRSGAFQAQRVVCRGNTRGNH